MISRLKKKVILLTAVSLLALLLLIVSGMNAISYLSLVNESDEILAYISESGGRFPEEMPQRPDTENEGAQKPLERPRRFSEELQFETRYFSVVLTGSGDTVRTDTGRIAAVSAGEAVQYAKSAVSRRGEKGFIGNYRYNVTKEGENLLVTFLDCTRKLDSYKTFLIASTTASLAGYACVLVIIIIISGRIIRPIAESYEKQKRFITDASHELRTPLAIINANIDIIEDEVEDGECISDMRNQTKRLKDLTEDLVTLSRMEEGGNAIQKAPFDASATAADTAAGFSAPAAAKGIEFNASVEPGITVCGDCKAFSRVVSILLDNAVKYANRGGSIDFSLTKSNKFAVLSCKNTTESEMTKENISRVFDRFYRTDESRNSSLGGHGIGLSIAKAAVEAHGGKITAAAPDTHTFTITATFPT